MLADDLVDVGTGLAGIPYPLGVYDHGRAEFAAVEAAGVIDARFGQAQRLDAAFHVIAQGFRIFFGAAAARMPGLAPVGAAENMVGIKWRFLIHAL